MQTITMPLTPKSVIIRKIFKNSMKGIVISENKKESGY
jgi:hypothetical protein